MNPIDIENIGARVAQAIHAAHLSQRQTASLTGIAQSRLSRITAGEVIPKAPELLVISRATGVPFGVLSGSNDVSQRAQYAARASGNSNMASMTEIAERFLELNDYMHKQRLR